MSRHLPLNRFVAHNFRAIRHSDRVVFTPLTAFIGNNGSGKSSLIEAMETLQTLVLDGLDAAMQRWHGFEHIWNRAVPHGVGRRSPLPANPMILACAGRSGGKTFRRKVNINAQSENLDRLLVESYQVAESRRALSERMSFVRDGRITDPCLTEFVQDWQFLRLAPDSMTEPVPRKRTNGRVRLVPDGSNIAEYLLDIRDRDTVAFDGIVDTLRYVLPFARNLQPDIASELERKVHLMLTEDGVAGKLPGWLLSTGTLRVLALLAVFRHPAPSKVIVIEELENGLDPRTVHLIVEEIRAFLAAGLGQVIVTTHSPYLLDLLSLDQLVLVERDSEGSPSFHRPADDQGLAGWAERFTPGRLYTMGSMSGKGGGNA